MLRKSLVACIMFCLLATIGVSQEEKEPILSLEQIFKNGEFRAERTGKIRWLDDGRYYSKIESSKEVEKGKEIVFYEPESGERIVKIPGSKLILPGENKTMDISDYHWSPNNKYLLLFTNTSRVWRMNTRGDYWLLNLENWKFRRIGKKPEPSSLMFAKFSPDSKKIAYVYNNNIYVENVLTGYTRQLTWDGSETIINGTSDWVYEEEFRLRDGFCWSPDSRNIAYWQFNTDGVQNFLLINNTDSLYSYTIPVQYPKAGTTNSACRVGIVPAAGAETRWLDVPGDPRNNYIPYMEWANNSQQVMLQRMNRLQNTNQVMLGNVATGKVETIHTERDSAWLNVVRDVTWLDDGKYFLWLSERDGWQHAYKISRDGKKQVLLTKGDYDVISIEHVDQAGGWLYFIASPENPARRYLYRVRLNGRGKLERLSPEDQPGTHAYNISPNSKWAIHTYSTFDDPPITDIISLPKHQSIRTLVSNEELRSKLAGIERNKVEFFRIEIGNRIELDGWMLKPPEFDATKRYPLLYYVYGEPVGQTVLDRWAGRGPLWYYMLAQQGYVIISIDNRGTPAPRGRKWRKCVYQRVGILSSVDQAAAASKINKWSFVDSTRIGIWGWSGGGSMSLNMIFRYPDQYHVALAIAPVANQRYYDTVYQERYMGLPQDNADGYEQGSPVTFAKNLKGKLLIVHGTADDNVHYQNTEAVINELIKHNKPFTMMAYPNRSHSIYEGENTTLHLFSLLTNYLYQNLPAGGK